jgi:hypothetical protein
MLCLLVLLDFRFLLPLTVVYHTAFTCHFTNISNILLHVRIGPIFYPQMLLCVSFKHPLSSPSDFKACLIVTTVSISMWCSVIPFPQEYSAGNLCFASVWLCYMFLVKVPGTCRNNMQDSILYLLCHKGATRLLLCTSCCRSNTGHNIGAP